MQTTSYHFELKVMYNGGLFEPFIHHFQTACLINAEFIITSNNIYLELIYKDNVQAQQKIINLGKLKFVTFKRDIVAIYAHKFDMNDGTCTYVPVYDQSNSHIDPTVFAKEVFVLDSKLPVFNEHKKDNSTDVKVGNSANSNQN
jgi:hypothetical protein